MKKMIKCMNVILLNQENVAGKNELIDDLITFSQKSLLLIFLNHYLLRLISKAILN